MVDGLDSALKGYRRRQKMALPNLLVLGQVVPHRLFDLSRVGSDGFDNEGNHMNLIEVCLVQ